MDQTKKISAKGYSFSDALQQGIGQILREGVTLDAVWIKGAETRVDPSRVETYHVLLEAVETDSLLSEAKPLVSKPTVASRRRLRSDIRRLLFWRLSLRCPLLRRLALLFRENIRGRGYNSTIGWRSVVE